MRETKTLFVSPLLALSRELFILQSCSTCFSVGKDKHFSRWDAYPAWAELLSGGAISPLSIKKGLTARLAGARVSASRISLV